MFFLFLSLVIVAVAVAVEYARVSVREWVSVLDPSLIILPCTQSRIYLICATVVAFLSLSFDTHSIHTYSISIYCCVYFRYTHTPSYTVGLPSTITFRKMPLHLALLLIEYMCLHFQTVCMLICIRATLRLFCAVFSSFRFFLFIYLLVGWCECMLCTFIFFLRFV